MRIPILFNARVVVRSWQAEEPVEPEVRYTGYGPDLDLGAVEQVVEGLSAFTRGLAQNDAGLRQFDQRAARLLGEQLILPPADAADRRFWQWFSITQAERVVLWRWKKADRAQVSADRWLGGWKDTFRRLWLRASLVRDPQAADPLELAGHGDEDFWVGIIERDIASCRVLVRTLVRTFFLSPDGTAESKQRMLHYRGTIKRLRQIRPSRVYEQMAPAEVETLVREAMGATVPAADRPTPARTTRRGRARVKGKRKA
jgi:hypothetical protein